jgi:hypothetical protein
MGAVPNLNTPGAASATSATAGTRACSPASHPGGGLYDT